MEVAELLSQVRDSITVKRVFGEPIERDGATIVPVARVRGGGGGGRGEQGDNRHGQGMGFGVWAGPAGVYVIRDGQVSWQPAVDVNRIVLGGQLAAVTLFLVIRSLGKARARRRTRTG